MVLHLAMPAHVLGFFAAAVDPIELLELATNLVSMAAKGPSSNILVTLVPLVLFFSLVLYHGCLSHPFLLSDNR